MNYETVIGLEVHVQLKTKTKAFCGCSTEFGKEPNTQVCPICLGFPGSLPVLNKTYLDYAIKVALSLNCQVQEYTKFDRKNYFYPDLPKDYQISQYDLPLSLNGHLEITAKEESKRIGIRRVHMEEDAGKLIHGENESFVDFNRTGMPLLEIVSEPDINSPEEAYAYLTKLKSILEYLDVSDCDMEKGSLRCDANISLKPQGAKELGVKTELKNMNSFKGVRDALDFEIKRQSQILDEGGKIIQETLLWNAQESRTYSMRTKEEAQDYRYFPEPDLPPFIITQGKIEEIRQSIPELPEAKKMRFISAYGLSEYDAIILTASKKGADFAENCINSYPKENKKPVVNFIIGPLLAEANMRNCALADLPVKTEWLAQLLEFLDSGQISNLTAKNVLAETINTQVPPEKIIKDKNLIQISDTTALEKHVDEVIKANPQSVDAYKNGKVNALMFLVGQVMKASKGQANPKIVQDILKRRL